MKDISNLTPYSTVQLHCEICNSLITRIVKTILISRSKQNNRDICILCIRKESGKKWGDIGRRNQGKTLNEIYGSEKAEEISAKLSASRTGEKNHNFGGVHQKFPIRTGTLESQFGVEKANEIKAKISKATSGSNNPMFGKPSPEKSGSGISGYYKNIYFRSLLELSYILHLKEHNIEFCPCDGRKFHKFPYTFEGKHKNYFPDFYLPQTDTYIEIKPFNLLNNTIVQAKINAVAAKHNIMLLCEKDFPRITLEKLLELIELNIVKIDKNKLHKIHNIKS